MMFSIRNLAISGLGLMRLANALSATILADTNRDGSIDVEGNSDVEGKDTWTEAKGALFLANIGDTNQRCAKSAALDTCNDAEGEELRNPNYLAPLRTLPIRGLSASAVGTVQILDKVSAAKTRIFVKSGETWNFVSSNYTFTASDLQDGLELGIDARDVRRPGGWDGNAQVQFNVTDGAESAGDMVALRVAPVLTHHHVQLAQRILTGNSQFTADESRFVANVLKNVADAGISEPVYQFAASDLWTQDFFEPGYSSIPGPDGPVSLRIMIRSSQNYRTAGKEIFTGLRSASVGAVQHAGDGSTRDSMGNLETIPPYTYNGKSYPAGRIIMGNAEYETPLILDFLHAQETQDPLILDTSWLAVGHVDEFIQFLPAESERGWVLVADDPLAGLALLKKASADGHGGEKAMSRSLLAGEDSGHGYCTPTNTIDQILALKSFEAYQQQTAQLIEGNLQRLKNATGLTDGEIFRMPATFYDAFSGGWSCKTNANTAEAKILGGPSSKAKSIIEAATPLGTVGKRADSDLQVAAFYPGMVNGVVLSDNHVLVPNPWGPIVDGKDILAAEAIKLYAGLGFNITFQDDWFSHHLLLGEIHCGTNTWRDTSNLWWKT